MKKLIWLILLVSVTICEIKAQINTPLFSEPGIVMQRLGFTNVTIKYERPMVKGRKIYGGLVPFGEVWRTGAGPCTKIIFDKPVTINKTKIKAGTYALLSIPDTREWTIILNTDTSLYGAYKYQKMKDVVRMTSKPRQTNRFYEALTIDVDIVDNNAQVYLSWENTQVSFTIETETNATFMHQIQKALAGKNNLEPDDYAVAADYIIHNREMFGPGAIDTTLLLINRSLSLEEESYFYRIKRDILKLMKAYDKYLEVSKQHIDFLQRAKPYHGFEKDVEKIQAEIYRISQNKKKK